MSKSFELRTTYWRKYKKIKAVALKPWSNEHTSHRKFLAWACLYLVLSPTCNGLWWLATNLSLFKSFNLRRLASCLNTKHKSMNVFGIKIKHGGLGWSRCCFESKQHSQRKQQSQTGQGQMKKKGKWSNSEIHKLIEEGRTCLWDTFSMDCHKKRII